MAGEAFLRPLGGLLGASRRPKGYRRATEMLPTAAGGLREATEDYGGRPKGYGGRPKATEGDRRATREALASCRKIGEAIEHQQLSL